MVEDMSMKKIITFLTFALAAFALVVSCDKKLDPQVVDPDTPEAPASEQITITVTIPSGLTKVTLTPDDDPDGDIKLAWAETDKIWVIDAADATNKAEFGIDQIDPDKPYIATFTGTAVSASSFNIVYGAESVAAVEAFDCSSQTQNGDASTSHLQFMALLSGVDSCQDIEFSKTWAQTHGGEFEQNGILRLRIQVPDEVNSVKEVSITGPGTNFFGNTDCITVSFAENVAPDATKHSVTAYAMLPVGNVLESSDGSFEVSFVTADQDIYRKSFSPGAVSFKPGVTNAVKLNKTGFVADEFAGGTGVEGDPWLIANKRQIKNMRSNMPLNETKYFKMIDDINLENDAWEPLNYDEKFKRGIYFDGNNKTISNLNVSGEGDSGFGYPSFVGVLNGTIKDVTIDGVTISAANNKAGAVGGYIGTSGIVGHCIGVTVKNVTISGTNYLGGFCGQVGNAGDSFEDCHVLGNNLITQIFATADAERSTGGFAGHASTAASYTNCTVKVNVTQGEGMTINAVGGFIGKADGGVSTFTGCEVLEGSSVSGHSNVGGFVGYNTRASIFNNCMTAANVIGDGECLGGFVGKADGGKFGESTPCIASGTVTGSADVSYYIGGFVGITSAASYNGCSYQGAAVTSNANTSDKNSLAGGFCGRSAGVQADSFVNCYVYNNTSGTTVKATLQRAGGFIGQSGAGNSTNLGTFNGCFVKNVTVVPGDKNSGGFVGVAYVPITNCYVDGGSIKAAGVSTGGFAGHVEKVDITGCYSSMAVDANGKSDVGGLFGYVASANTISKCYYSGNITASGQANGGIVGHTGNVAAIIENCYSIGNLTTTAKVQIHGGIVGELGTGGTVINCYSTMTINGGRVLGGIVGRAASGGWNYESETNNTISGCIAFNQSVSATQTGTYGSSGAIVGVTSIKNTLNSSYRLYNMTFVNSNEWGNTMVDQVDCDGTNWTRDTATGTGPGNQCAYFGKAAASNATVTTVARDVIGWSSDVWDFTDDLPTLK